MGKLKRCLAGLLAVATVLSSSNIAYAAQGITRNGDTDVFSMTAAEAVAIHYELNAEETAVLGNSAILQGVLPDANLPEETLVTVNSIEKTVSAKEYVAENDAYKWVPVSVTTKATDAQETIIDENILFNDPVSGVYTSEKFTADGAYSVHVSYELHYNVTSVEQTRVLGIPAILKDGMSYMGRLEDLRSKLGLFQEKDVFDKVLEAKETIEKTLEEKRAEAYEEAVELVKEEAYEEAVKLAKEEAYKEAVKLAKEEAYKEAVKLAKEEAYKEAVKLAKEEAYKEAVKLAKEEAKEEAYKEAVKLAKEEAYEKACKDIKDQIDNSSEIPDELKEEAYEKAIEELNKTFDAEFEEEFNDADNKAKFDAEFESKFEEEFEEEFNDVDNKAKFDAEFETKFNEEFNDPENKAEFDAEFEIKFEEEFNDAENKAEFEAKFEEEFEKELNDPANKAEFEAKFEEEFENKFNDPANKAEFEAKFEEEFEKEFNDPANKAKFEEEFEKAFNDEIQDNYGEIPLVISAIDALEKDINGTDGSAKNLDYYNNIGVEEGKKLPFFINNQAAIRDNGTLKANFEKIAGFINNDKYKDYVTGDFKDVVDTLNEIVAEFTYFATEKDVTPLKSILATDAAGNIYTSNAEFEALVTALLGEGVVLKSETTTPDATWLKVFAYDVVKAVDAASIEITVRAQAASDIVDNFELVDLEIGKKTIVLAAGLKADEIKGQIDAALDVLLNGDDENVGFIEKWAEAGYDVTDDSVYQKPTEFVYPTELVADEKYTCETCYVPNLYNLSNEYMDEQYAYHGTKIMLPLYDGAGEVSYDYKVIDTSNQTYESYNEGAIIVVDHDMKIERTEVERTFVRLLGILPQSHDYQDVVKNIILNSSAIKSPLVSLRYPSADVVDPVKTRTVTDANMVESVEHYAKAITVATGIEGMIWEPADAELVRMTDNGELILDTAISAEPLENNGGKLFYWVPQDTDYDYLRVNYKLKITTILEDNKYVVLDTDKLETYLDLPKTVVNEVKVHKDILENKIDLVYTSITGNLKTVMNTAVLKEVAGLLSDGTGKGNEAVAAILAANKGDKLNLYTYLEASLPAVDAAKREYDLAGYLYHGYYEKIREEAIFLAPHLRAIAGDPKLGEVLGDFGVTVDDSLIRQIYNFAEKLDGIKVEADGSLTDTMTGGLKNTIKDLSDDILVDDQVQFTALINGIVNEIIEKNVAMKDFTDADAAKGAFAKWSGTSDAPGKASINISATGANGDTASAVYSFSVNDDATEYKLNSTDAAKIAALYQNVKEQVGITVDNMMYYVETFDKELPTDNTVLTFESGRAFYYSFTYVTKEYEEPVMAKGTQVDTVKFTGSDVAPAIIVLPALADSSEYKYVYTITEIVDGNEVVTTVDCANGNGTYTVKNLKDLALGNDTLKIVRSKYSLETDKIDRIVNAFNEGLKDSGASFVKVKDYTGEADNGIYKAIVMRMDADMKVETLLPAFGSAMVNVAFETDYIGFGADGKDAFLTRDEENGTQVQMQALINLLLNSEISLKSIADMTDENGSILADKNLKFNADYTVDNNGKALGGELVKSGITFDAAATAIPFYITMNGKNSEALKSIKNLHNSYGNNVSMGTKTDAETGEGTLALDATMPDKVYALYLSVMLMTGVIEESDLAEVEPSLEEQIKMLKEQLELNFLGEVNYEVIENTINTYLYNGNDEAVDLAPYASFIDTIIKTINGILNNEDGVYDGNPSIVETKSEGGMYAFTMTYDIADMLAKAEGIGDFVGFLGENTKIKIPMSFSVLNISAGVKAIVLDWSQPGLDKLRYIESVAEYLNGNSNSTGPVYVYLLEDIGKIDGYEKLYIDVPTVLNLNGHTVLPDIQANASLTIVDSELNTAQMGTVYAEIFGDNVSIAAGRYPLYNPSDAWYVGYKLPASMIREGYYQEGDTVVNELYSISKNDDAKTIDVALATEFVDMLQSDKQTVLLEMLSDVVFNVYTEGKVAVNGNVLFAADTEGLMDDYTGVTGIANKLSSCVNIPNMKKFVNDMYAEFGNYDKLVDQIENGGEITSFDLTTANWGVKTRLLGEEGNKYIGIDLATDKEETYNVRFYFKDQNPELAAALRTVKELVTFNRSFSYDGFEISNGSVNIKGSLELKVLVDLTKNVENDPQKSSDYVTAIAAILAYSLEEGPERDRLVSAIVDYENNIYAGALEEEIDKLTVRQFINAVKKAGEWHEVGTDENNNPVYERVPFEEILKELGLRNLLSDTIEIEASYAYVLDIVYRMISYVDRALNALDNAQDRIEIYENALGSSRVKDVQEVIDKETGKVLYVRTYGGGVHSPYGKAITLDARMKLFSENYVPPVDDAMNALKALPSLDDIYKVDEDGNVIFDNREKYVSAVADARAAYDELSDSMKEYIPDELYEKLLAIEAMYNSWGIWVAKIDPVHYTGKAHKPVVHVYDGAKLLTNKSDYTVTYKYNVNAADESTAKAPRVIVKLRKNYSGTVYAYFTIKQIDLVEAYNNPEYAKEVGLTINDVNSTATTSKKTTNFKKPVVYLNGKKVSTADYGLYYNDNPTADKKSEAYKEGGSAYPITVYGKGKNFTAVTAIDANGKEVIDKTVGYTVYQHVASYLMSGVSVAKIANQYYTGEEIILETAVYGEGPLKADKTNNNKLVVTFKSGNKVMNLYEGVHFYANYMNNVDAGTVTVALVGTQMSEKTYAEEYNLTHPAEQIPMPEGGFDTRSFVGTKTITFKIVGSQKLTSSMVTMMTLQEVDGAFVPTPIKKGYVTKTYTGKEITLDNGFDYVIETADKTALEEGKDYTVTYKKNINKGTATATFKGVGNYTGTVTKSFKINAAPIKYLLTSDTDIQVTYQKSGVKPVSEIILKNSNTRRTLVNSKDYALSFANTAKVATYNDELGKYVYENPKAPAGEKVIDRVDLNNRLLYGSETNPVSETELKVANKYMPKVVIKGKGNYTGTITLYYAVTPAKFDEIGVTATAKNVKWTSKSNNWATSVTLKDVNGKKLEKGINYDKAYTYFQETENGSFVEVKPKTNIPAGTKMKVVVNGIGKYEGSVEAQYYIYAKSINSSKTKITWDEFDKTYNKYEKKPANIRVTYNGRDLVKGVDYEILETNYKQNTFVGTAKITIKGIGEFSGTKTRTFKILQFKHNAVNLASGKVVFDKDIVVTYQKGGVKPADQLRDQLTYTMPSGKTVTLKEGRDYKLTWYNTSKVAVEENGNYVYKDAKSKLPRVRITGIGNYKGYMDVYYTIIPADLSTETNVTVKDVKWDSKAKSYKTSVTAKAVNGKKLESGKDYKIGNFFIKVIDTADTSSVKYKWVNVKECFGKKDIIVDYADGKAVNVEITASGKLNLNKGQKVSMKIEVVGVNGYKNTVETEYVVSR